MAKGIHYLDPKPFPVWIAAITCEKAFKRELKRLKVTKPINFLQHERAAATAHCLTDYGSLIVLLCFGNIANRPMVEIVGLIAHEATHAVQWMREEFNRNEPFCHETEAYLIQYITQETFRYVVAR